MTLRLILGIRALFTRTQNLCAAFPPTGYTGPVNDTRHIFNLALVGFMGTGKSSVGRAAAELLQFEFVDTDALIEARFGCSITDIFAREGEPAFRQYEKEAIAGLSRRRGLVIATGGGAVVDPGNMDCLKTHSLVIWLCASPETIWERVRNQTHRPLLQTPDPLGRIRELMALREPAYRRADVHLLSCLRAPREVAQQIVHQFHLAHRR